MINDMLFSLRGAVFDIPGGTQSAPFEISNAPSGFCRNWPEMPGRRVAYTAKLLMSC
jgi:hypothetical protein